MLLKANKIYETCELSGEKCLCFTIPGLTFMNCLEKYTNIKTLNLNQIGMLENITQLYLYIENKIFDRILPSYNEFLLKLSSLTIRNNQILNLEANSFQMLTNLVSLDLSSNSIEEIQSFSFVGLNSLDGLMLFPNKIRKIECNSFLGLKSLVKLELNSNFINNIPKGTFNGLNSLIKLELYFNKLTAS